MLKSSFNFKDKEQFLYPEPLSAFNNGFHFHQVRDPASTIPQIAAKTTFKPRALTTAKSTVKSHAETTSQTVTISTPSITISSSSLGGPGHKWSSDESKDPREIDAGKILISLIKKDANLYSSTTMYAPKTCNKKYQGMSYEIIRKLYYEFVT